MYSCGALARESECTARSGDRNERTGAVPPQTRREKSRRGLRGSAVSLLRTSALRGDGAPVRLRLRLVVARRGSTRRRRRRRPRCGCSARVPLCRPLPARGRRRPVGEQRECNRTGHDICRVEALLLLAARPGRPRCAPRPKAVPAARAVPPPALQDTAERPCPRRRLLRRQHVVPRARERGLRMAISSSRVVDG